MDSKGRIVAFLLTKCFKEARITTNTNANSYVKKKSDLRLDLWHRDIYQSCACILLHQEKIRERGRVGTAPGICEFLKSYFWIGSLFPRRPRLFMMTSYECIKNCGMLFGVIFFIHQAVRFTTNWRICLQLHDLGQDKPISLLLKPFSWNKRLFHSGRHVEFSNFADVAGTRRPFSWHL